jgi:hypothetical protein
MPKISYVGFGAAISLFVVGILPWLWMPINHDFATDTANAHIDLLG